MKVLQVINSLNIGGAEKLLVDSVPIYNSLGIKTEVLILCNSETAFYNNLKNQGVIFHQQLNNRSVYNPLNIYFLKKHLKKYDIIHVHLFPSLYWVAISKILFNKSIKIIFTEHNTTNRRMSNTFLKKINKLIYKQYNQIVTISDAVDFKMRSYLGNEFSNISKIYNGVNLKSISDSKPYLKKVFGFKESDVLLIQVSSFTSQKDQKTLLRALAILPTDYKLLLIGDGPLKSECINLCSEIHVINRVQFLGLRDDVSNLLKTSDIVILSSNYEGLSLSCIEGMASGKPFIASNAPGLGDIVKDYGILFETGNYKDLAKKIKLLIEDSNLYLKTVNSCLHRAHSFNINIMVNKYIKLYKELIA